MTKSVSKLLGFSQNELIDQNISKIAPECFRSEHDKFLMKYIDDGSKTI